MKRIVLLCTVAWVWIGASLGASKDFGVAVFKTARTSFL